MRILTRYILREVTAHALIGVAIFTFVLFTRDLGRILELVVRASAPLPSVAEIFFFTVPLALTYTIPMSVLVGILIGLSRLAADSEITAMRASGIGVWSSCASCPSSSSPPGSWRWSTGLHVAPRSQAALGRLEDRLKGSQVSFEVQPRVFYEGFPKLVLYVQDVQNAQGAAMWKGVFMADLSDAANPKITLAKEGIVVSEGPDRLHLHLIDGSAHETDPNQTRPLSDFHVPADRYPDRSAVHREQARRVDPRRPSWTPARCSQKARRMRSRLGPLVSDRISPPLRAAHRLPGAGVGRNSAGAVVEEKRQVGRIRADHPAGLRLLRGLADRSFSGPAGHGLAVVRGVAGRLCFSRRWDFSCSGGPKNVPLNWLRSELSGSATRPWRCPQSAAPAARMPSSAPPPGAAYSAPAFPRCSTITCCATSSSTWG